MKQQLSHPAKWHQQRRLQILALSLISLVVAVITLSGRRSLFALAQLDSSSSSRSNPLVECYRSLYAAQMALPVSQRRYLVFDLEDEALGWGNRLEGTGGAFYVALRTSRIFVIRNHPLWETVFETDPSAPNRWSVHRDDIESQTAASQVRLDDDRFGTFIGTEPSRWESQLLRNASVAFATTALTRPMVYATALFGDERGFYTEMGRVFAYLGAYPSSGLRDGLRRARRRFNMSAAPAPDTALVVVQMRTMFDDAANHQRAMLAPKQAAFWACAAGALRGLDPDRTEILFTTDDPSLNGRAVDRLGQYGLGLIRMCII